MPFPIFLTLASILIGGQIFCYWGLNLITKEIAGVKKLDWTHSFVLWMFLTPTAGYLTFILFHYYL